VYARSADPSNATNFAVERPRELPKDACPAICSPSLRHESYVLNPSTPSLNLIRRRQVCSIPFAGLTSMATNTLFATAGPIEVILEHEIRIRAYELYTERGARDGRALDDWLQAEYEVLRERGAVGLSKPSNRAPYR
jgi:Protein of unknown function (DUF2934)